MGREIKKEGKTIEKIQIKQEKLRSENEVTLCDKKQIERKLNLMNGKRQCEDRESVAYAASE